MSNTIKVIYHEAPLAKSRTIKAIRHGAQKLYEHPVTAGSSERTITINAVVVSKREKPEE